jgi:integrase
MTLRHELLQLCKHNRDGAYATQRDRRKVLVLSAKQLHKLGFRGLRATSLKRKHIDALVETWWCGNAKIRTKPLSDATIKNRMSHLRWWACKFNKKGVVPARNADLNIGKRARAKASKAVQLTPQISNCIQSSYLRYSLLLQAAFGLRRQEAMKIRPMEADKGDQLFIRGSSAKGGRPRYVPIIDSQQRLLLDEVKAFTGNGSLIPPHLSYRQHLRTFEYRTTQAGISKTHGLRHAYAHRRYLTLTGWACPVSGGPAQRTLSIADRALDEAARLLVAEEIGHSRTEIASQYLGT